MNLTTMMEALKEGEWNRSADTGWRLGLAAKTAVRYRVPRWKRILDIGVILLVAPGWVPLMAGISALIKLLSPGPILFRQERIGLGGKRFNCMKFRTMHVGAPTSVHEKYVAELIRSNHPMTKLDGEDPRLIPFARMLRASGLDELPQLFNVLRGEMSLVGPRPCTAQEYAAYSVSQRARTDGLPGLTGLWQVSGKNRTTFNEMIEMDIRYVRTSCLRIDMGIMFRTPVALWEQVVQTLLNRSAKSSSARAELPGPARVPAGRSGDGAVPADRVQMRTPACRVAVNARCQSAGRIAVR